MPVVQAGFPMVSDHLKVSEAIFYARCVGEGLGHSCWMSRETLTRPLDVQRLLPIDAKLIASDIAQGWKPAEWALYEVGDMLLTANVFTGSKTLYVTVAADTVLLGAHLLGQVVDRLAPVPPVPDDKVNVRFWYTSTQGPQNVQRKLEAPAWGDIRRNYTAKAREQLDELADTDLDAARGRLVLLHGPPGTGKTTAIRAMARRWKNGCYVDYVTDPEMFFGQSAYMISVLLGEVGHPDYWRIVIVEDAEEFIVPNAKGTIGQSAGRLLNLCDGMIGQGLKVLVMLTTNVPIAKLAESITRPGRCLANINVGRLTRSEAGEWLGHVVGAEQTIAELYSTLEERSVIGTGLAVAGSGTYI